MIILAIILFAVIIIARFRYGMFTALLVIVASKSIMDVFWEIKLGPLSVLALQGVLLPFLFYPVLTIKKKFPRSWIVTANIYLIALSFGFLWAFLAKPVQALETIFINLNIYIGFILIPLLIDDQKKLRFLLLAFMISGVFPILVSIFQLQTGVIFQERQTVGLTRYVGFYHDGFSVRFHGLITLFAVILYQYLFKIENFIFKMLLLLLGGGALISIYAVFSKAGVGILGSWVVLLLLFSKSRTKQIFSLLVALSILFLVFGDSVSTSIEQLFSKEVGYQTGEVTDARYTLAGRGYIWENYWDFWVNKQNMFFQWVGDGLARPVHNEMFRILLANGIIGVIFLLFFIVTIIRTAFSIHKNVMVFGLMLLCMYLIDSIGLVPGTYYYYNMLVWGIFGTLLMKPQLFKKQK